MKKFLFVLIAVMLSAGSLYAEDDDSTPYMPYPQIQPQAEQPKNNTQKKAPAKKKTTKKKKTVKKKTPAKKPAPKKQTSLEKGIALMQEERYEAAKPYLLKAIQENRNDPNAWYWYGVYHEKTGGFNQAQYFYSKAVTIDPAFEPLSRIVYYPNDSEKTPLWDPKRPARVYPVATKNDGVGIGQGNFPSAPNDPEIPKVPVYVPPEPGSSPLTGDNWAPAVYVPPSPEEVPEPEGSSPVYMPPQAGNIIAETQENNNEAENYSYKIPGYSSTYINDENRRADVPLYNPPEPNQNIAQAPKQSAPKAQTVKAKPAKKENVQAPRKVVKQTAKKKSSPPKNEAKTKKKATQTPAQPKQQTQSPKKQQEPERRQTPPQNVEPVRQVEPVRPAEPVEPEQEAPQPERRQPEYLPPVGQFAPDPGTILDTPIPPVGQGSQY